MYKFRIFTLFVFGLWMGVAGAQQGELLPPEEAFAFSARAVTPDWVEVNWKIAPDYYMYRDRFQVRLLEGEAQLGDPQFPAGKITDDPFFGKLETYRDQVVIGVPVSRTTNAPITLSIEAEGQGCNDPIGVCYPPTTQSTNLSLPALGQGIMVAAADVEPSVSGSKDSTLQTVESLRNLLAASQAPPETEQFEEPVPSKGTISVQTLKDLFGAPSAQPEFLGPNEAYRIELQSQDAESLLARFTIADGYYLYQEKTGFSSQTEGVSVDKFSMPQGKKKTDEFFGDQIVYYNGFDVELPLSRMQQGPEDVAIQVRYQGCADLGICYPPMDKVFTVSLPGISDAQAAPTPGSGGRSSLTGGDGEINPSFVDSKMFWPILLAFAAGLALTFTPCVLPMIPILASIVVGQGGGKSKARAGLLSIVYVLGTSVTYTAVGAVAGATGNQLQAYFQNPWGIGFVVFILVLLSLSMFGLYDVHIPSSVQTKLQARAGRVKGGAMGGVFVMGMISALIVGACVSPVLMAVLGLAIERADPVLGGMIMFSLAMGSGVVLIGLGFGAAFLLPKAGRWLENVKYVFGVMLLGVAIYILGALPEVPVLYLWGMLLIVTAVYLGALQSLPATAGGWRYLWKGFGVFALVWGVLALLGGMTGSRDIMNPMDLSGGALITGISSDDGEADENANSLFTRISEIEVLDSKLSQARADGLPVMLDYYADWCVDCVRMERSTFVDPTVRRIMNDFVMLQIDVTDPRNPETNAIKKRYGIYGPPAMLFFDVAGNEISELRRYGYMGPEEFVNHVKKI